jgi:Mitochondrial carrier protein
VEVAKNATQTSVLMAGLSADHRGLTISSVAPKKNVGRVSSIAATREIFRRYGFLGLYTGFKLHLARDVIGSAIYFGVYEATKQAMTSLSQTEKANTPLAVATAGMLCGMCSWSLVSSSSSPFHENDAWMPLHDPYRAPSCD